MHDPARSRDSDQPHSSPSPATDDGNAVSIRTERLMPEIAERLRPVCADWEEERFQALVRQIAELEGRWLEREGRPQEILPLSLDGWRRNGSQQDGQHLDGRRHDGNDRPLSRRDGRPGSENGADPAGGSNGRS